MIIFINLYYTIIKEYLKDKLFGLVIVFIILSCG